MAAKEQESFIDMLMERSEMVSGKHTVQIGSRDTKDNKFLACAKEARADYIITGDQDLLILKMYEEIKIITPREMQVILAKK